MELRKSIKKYNLTDFKIMDIIGKGTNAQVHFTKNTITNKHFSLKIIKKNEVVKFKQVDHIMNEINILHIIDHPFIVNTSNPDKNRRLVSR
jgi:serine/threonine protein kinase